MSTHAPIGGFALELLPVSRPETAFGMTPASQALIAACQRLTLSERVTVFAALSEEPGPNQELAAERHLATWMGLGIGLVVGVGGLYLTGKTLGWCR